jgi:hypothetical protein
VLPHVLLLVLGVLACTALSAYIFSRCDRRPTTVAVMVFQLGFFVLLLSLCMDLVGVTPEQHLFYDTVEIVGLAIAAVGGAFFVLLVAFKESEGWRALGFAALSAASLAADRVYPFGPAGAPFPSTAGLLYLFVAAYITLNRRELFPELTLNVLDAAIFDSRDAVVIFDAEGMHVESGVSGLADVVSFTGMTDIADFLRRIKAVKAAGDFLTPEDIHGLDERGTSRELALRGPEGTRHYLVFANAVRPERRSRLGSVFGFYDITEQKHLEAELVERTAELSDINVRLVANLPNAERLESERARRAAAEEVQGILGSRIEGVIASVGEGAGVQQLIDGCREVMADLRATVAALFAGERGKGGRA